MISCWIKRYFFSFTQKTRFTRTSDQYKYENVNLLKLRMYHMLRLKKQRVYFPWMVVHFALNVQIILKSHYRHLP
jgi:exoribonuclease R